MRTNKINLSNILIYSEKKYMNKPYLGKNDIS